MVLLMPLCFVRLLGTFSKGTAKAGDTVPRKDQERTMLGGEGEWGAGSGTEPLTEMRPMKAGRARVKPLPGIEPWRRTGPRVPRKVT